VSEPEIGAAHKSQKVDGPWPNRLRRQCRVGRYQKKHSPTHTHPDHRTSFINFLHLLRSIASYVFSFYVLDSPLQTTPSLQVLFGLLVGLGPSTSYSTHFFTQSSSSLALLNTTIIWHMAPNKMTRSQKTKYISQKCTFLHWKHAHGDTCNGLLPTSTIIAT